jgi:hypothetical protein
MNLFRKNTIVSGAFAALFLLTELTASPAAHASSPSLVQATNQLGASAIDGLVPSTKIITLIAFANPGTDYALHQLSASGTAAAPFVVPPNQNFVITSVEITPFSNDAEFTPNYVYLVAENPYAFYELWLVSNQVSTSFQYPTGVVLQAGTSPAVVTQLTCDIFIHGYLTPA